MPLVSGELKYPPRSSVEGVMIAARYFIVLVVFMACGDMANDFYHGKDPTEIFHVREFGENFSVEENFLGRFSVVGKGGVSEDFSVSKSPDRDLGHFSQSEEVIKVESIKKVDILWTVDNSQSMERYQTALANNFSLFIEDFIPKDVDFKMAIITTDSATNRDTNNRLNSSELKRNKQNFINDFKKKIRVGTGGSNIERAFDIAKHFFDQNTSWNRTDALLVVIFVSDEREQGIQSVKHYTDAIVNSKGGKIEDVRVFAICNNTGYGSCQRFASMSQATNGLVRYIYQSFADISKEFGQSIVRNLTNLKTVFPLNVRPADSTQLRVKVNGSAVPRDTSGSEGWNYDGVGNAVKFFGGHIPSAGASIKIYEEGVVADTFCLAERIAPTRVDSLVVEVAGRTVPRDTTKNNGWNYDSTRNCVEFFGSYSPAKGESINITLPGEIHNFLCLRNKLNTNHLDKVEVTIGGSVVPKDDTRSHGWSYNEGSNCIEFFGNHTLSEGDVVGVSLGLNSQFCLNKRFDTGKLNDLKVIIGSQAISRDTTGVNGWDYNSGNNCIELYGEHGLTVGAPVKISWGQTSRFCPDKPLDKSKLETVVIKVDGAVVERGGQGVGWDYDSQSNCISFFGNRLPDIGSQIEVTYTADYYR